MEMQSCCFADQTYCFFDVLVAVPAIVAKAHYYQIIRTSGDSQIFYSTQWHCPQLQERFSLYILTTLPVVLQPVILQLLLCLYVQLMCEYRLSFSCPKPVVEVKNISCICRSLVEACQRNIKHFCDMIQFLTTS